MSGHRPLAEAASKQMPWNLLEFVGIHWNRVDVFVLLKAVPLYNNQHLLDFEWATNLNQFGSISTIGLVKS
jgi:uncharacterized paraquat-inducible protein A